MSQSQSQRRIDLEATMDEFWQNRAEAAEADVERLREALTRIRDGGSTFLYDGAGCASIAADALSREQKD